ncbi:MAG TPA: FGGY family carbohydrate kinase [Spirochaetia bacterium]|nr:FGGY family carbohydrate kinase [Spirochaetia bacterium]
MATDGYLLGFDVGSSSIKASLIESATGRTVGEATSPKTELPIAAPRPGWAEQDPATWWDNVVAAARELKASTGAAFESVRAIGISYQMHGLVLLDKAGTVLRPSIIWCDSRAVGIGEKAFKGIGEKLCLDHLLNSPGNFTASKLAWVKENEPDVYGRASTFMLPGDWVAFRMTGERSTTFSGLSEGILWDFPRGARADMVLDWYGISKSLVPSPVGSFAVQGQLSAANASLLGLPAGIPVSYRAGDQPNNAFSLGVLEPGEAATTAGTSGVVYGVIDAPRFDLASRVNTFVHVTHTPHHPRYGVLMCVNGTGILYSWLRRLLVGDTGVVPYDELNRVAAGAPVGADGLTVLPYGNGAERTLENRNPGASVIGLDFNRHGMPHLLRAGQEGIVYALNYGLQIMKAMGQDTKTIRAGNANMFLSPLFREAFATVTGTHVELYETNGAQGAARGAGVGAGLYRDPSQAFVGLKPVTTVEPDRGTRDAYAAAYGRWKETLERSMK